MFGWRSRARICRSRANWPASCSGSRVRRISLMAMHLLEHAVGALGAEHAPHAALAEQSGDAIGTEPLGRRRVVECRAERHLRRQRLVHGVGRREHRPHFFEERRRPR